MRKTILNVTAMFAIFSTAVLYATELREIKAQDFIYLEQNNKAVDSEDSNISYFKHYDNLPSQITMEIFKNQDLSHLAGKKLFVGYGTAEAMGKDCRVFKKEDTGYSIDTTICLPYWRIEREYIIDANPVANLHSAVELLPQSRPPMLVSICDRYADEKQYPGGLVTCVSYYDRLGGDGCWENPMQAKCRVSTCTENLKKHCTFKNVVMGEKTDLPGVVNNQTGTVPEEETTRVNLSTAQYVCPDGPLVDNVECVDKKQVFMFPAKCVDDDPNTSVNEIKYEYCNKNKPIRDGLNNIIGFSGTCSNGKEIVCDTKNFSNEDYVCVDPVYEDFTETKTKEQAVHRRWQEYQVDWVSAEPDMYSERENCLRVNSILDSRKQNIYINIKAEGQLDDDIYVLKHSLDGSASKIYCNMQHAPLGTNVNEAIKTCLDMKGFSFNMTEVTNIINCDQDANNINDDLFNDCLVVKDVNTTSLDVSEIRECVTSVDAGMAVKNYNGSVLGCLRNSGSYSVDMQGIPIDVSDIVTIQQNSEWEVLNPTPFAVGRNHYSSTKVNLNGKVVTPQAYASDFPHYPRSFNVHLKTWDNTTSTLTILFPFSGLYELYFYNKHGQEVIRKTINPTHFKEMQNVGFSQLKLAGDMALSPNVNRSTAGLSDHWVEIGGGVYGGKGSKTGEPLSVPDDNYVKENAITSILIKDLIMGTITPIEMVYPLPYPNRVYISKLDVYEKRKYRCYEDFPTAPEDEEEVVETSYVCEKNPLWQAYKNDSTVDISGMVAWDNKDLCEQNCRTLEKCTSNDSNTSFTCAHNGFQSDNEGDCERNCYIQNMCDSYMQSNCTLTQQEVSHPVSDFTGKTLFSQAKMTFACEHKTKQYAGCAKYDFINRESGFNLNIGDVGVEVYKPASFEDVVTKANMLDMPIHIWSGWKGQCHKGMKMDSSYLSDPFTIAAYAMSAYASYTQLNGGLSLLDEYGGQFNVYMVDAQAAMDDMMMSVAQSDIGIAVSEAANTASQTVDEATTAVAETSDEIMTSMGETWDDFTSGFTTPTENLDETIGFAELTTPPLVDEPSLVNTVQASVDDAYRSTTEWLNHSYTEGIFDTRFINITNASLVRFGIDTALILAAPTEDEYQRADDLIKGMAGMSSSSSVVAYNSCMASIGLSMPNLVSWSMNDVNGTSLELNEPYKNPLRMTPDQLAQIAQNFGEKWVMRSYAINEDDPMLLQVLALSPNAYIEAGKTICAGAKVSAAMNQMLDATRPQDPPDPSGGKPLALSIGLAAVSMACPVCGLAATVVVDLYVNMLAEVDTCKNEDDAIAWDPLDYKTNLFLNHEQCVKTSVVCTKKAVWGECVQHRYNYCCYDSILTKIFAEGLKEQTGRGWSSCSDLTINDLKNISFRECKPGEEPRRDRCFSAAKHSEFKQVLFRQATKNMQGIDNIEAFSEHVQKSMAIPK